MKKFLVLAVLAGMVGAFAPVGSAQAEESKLFYYVGGKLGYNQQFLGKWKTVAKGNNMSKTTKYKGNDAPSMGIGLMGGIGYKIIPQLGVRGELEYMYRIPTEIQKYNKAGLTDANDKRHLQTQIHTILANLYLDYYVIPKVNLYASVGIGVALIDLQNKVDAYGGDPSSKSNYPMVASFAWQAGVGVGYEVIKNILLDLNVRYADFGAHDYTTESNYRTKFPLSAVEVNVGVAYKF